MVQSLLRQQSATKGFAVRFIHLHKDQNVLMGTVIHLVQHPRHIEEGGTRQSSGDQEQDPDGARGNYHVREGR